MQWMTMRAAGDTGSGYSGGGRSPIGIGGALAVHGGAIALFLLMPKEMIADITKWQPFEAVNVPIEPPPPEVIPDHPPKTDQPVIERPTRTDPFVKLPTGDPTVDSGPTTEPGSQGDGKDPVVIPPPPPPVLVDAQIDPRALPAFQPDYPGAMIRQSVEGSVTVRVTIGADGRVADIVRLSATDESFWLATQRHALRKWRFRAATRDGVAISSVKILTVHFRLEDR